MYLPDLTTSASLAEMDSVDLAALVFLDGAMSLGGLEDAGCGFS